MSVQSEIRERSRRSVAANAGDRSQPAMRVMAGAGLAGPIIFTVAFVVQGLFRVGEYSPVAETVSALEAGPNGWVQQINFVVFGVLMISYAVGLHLGVRPPPVSPMIRAVTP